MPRDPWLHDPAEKNQIFEYLVGSMSGTGRGSAGALGNAIHQKNQARYDVPVRFTPPAPKEVYYRGRNFAPVQPPAPRITSLPRSFAAPLPPNWGQRPQTVDFFHPDFMKQFSHLPTTPASGDDGDTLATIVFAILLGFFALAWFFLDPAPSQAPPTPAVVAAPARPTPQPPTVVPGEDR